MSVPDGAMLGLFLVQQVGVMLGVGAATLQLIAQVISTRDGVVQPAEARFARMNERVLMIGLLCMIGSGVLITGFHSLAGEASVIFTPAYLGKWMLIAIVALPLIVGHRHPFHPVIFAGFIGANWYALFVLHLIAPITSWVDLLLAYVAWVAGFLLVWAILARVLHVGRFKTMVDALSPAPAPAIGAPNRVVKPVVKPTSLPMIKPVAPVAVQKPTPPPPPVTPKVAAPVPAPAVISPAPHKPVELPPAHALVTAAPVLPHKPTATVPLKPPTKPEEKVEDPDQYPSLPAVRVMPRTPEDVDTQLRSTVVQFS